MIQPKDQFSSNNSEKKCRLTTCLEKNTGRFRNQIRIQRDMKHSWRSRQFRALKLSLQRMKTQICEKNTNLHKNLLPNWMRKCKIKLFRKQNLKDDTNQSIKQSLVFQNILYLLQGTKLKTADLEHSFQLDWVSEPEATLCWKWNQKTKTFISKTYGEKQKAYFSKNDTKRWIWRKTIIKGTNHIFFLLKRTLALISFWQFGPIGFLLNGWKGTSWWIVFQTIFSEWNFVGWHLERRKKDASFRD